MTRGGSVHFKKAPRGRGRGGGGGRGTSSGPSSSSANFNRSMKTISAGTLLSTESTSAESKLEAVRLGNTIDEKLGFPRYESGPKKVGWLINMQATVLEKEGTGGKAGMDYYFLSEDGKNFKATLVFEPYMLIAVKGGMEGEIEEWLRRKFEGQIKKIERVTKEDLSMPNHLLGYRRTFVKLVFVNQNDLMAVRKVLAPIAARNKKNVDVLDAYAEVASAGNGYDFMDDGNDSRNPAAKADAEEHIVDIREYDVPYHVRVAIDADVRVGKWYTVEAKHGEVTLTCIVDRLKRPDPTIMAYDIETTKLPLKFPDALIDQIMMISYMIDQQGFLITNREIVSEDIADFDYTPKPEYPGVFVVFNEPDERALLERFFSHIKLAKPTIIVTYNGDFFDWPFVEARASYLGIDMYQEVGFRKDSEDQYKSTYCCHMDAFSWVKRDSYLPQGSQGLKAVTTAKLGYDPDELDPELMLRYASERPQTLAEYSVSDAVATYYLYTKYVHPFIFSLCTIIPLGPDDVLRKGTGTLCEMLLMVQAYQKGIVLPNKHMGAQEAFYNGHLLESETYVGGHVESIEAGVFRSDIPTNFVIDTTAIDKLMEELDHALRFSIVVEGKKKVEDVTNFEEVKAEIMEKLLNLKEIPQRNEFPSIYHLDVASMYPNIMTTNRLQPDSMIKESDCAACDFNRPGKTCDRRLPWAWRGEYLPAKRDEYNMIKRSLENERFPPKWPNQPRRTWDDLEPEEQAAAVKKRLIDYTKKIYHKIHDTTTIEKEAIICQRENPFYVDTVKDFRDRRYDFKGQQRVWKGKSSSLKKAGAPAAEIDEAEKMIILFDSLQLAHKVILNSFYGYVMRKGSRWYSMEMAGVTCLTGAHIIQLAKDIVERIGRPLELDTDGIWCMLPGTFPENFAFTMKDGKKFPISYPCVMLNHLVHEKFTNDQYQELADPIKHRYETHSENTIFFEVDGPYRAMILPTSKEADKNLKKRYAVFNHDGTLAELKGFEVKRRGELKLIKIFQTAIFKFFLEGTTLKECYDAVASVSNQWLDVLYSHGDTMPDEELIDLICENRSMSKALEEYGAQKSTSITTAKRLAEFLGEQMVKDKGLNCKFIVSAKPHGAPVAERAVPVAIFSAEESVKQHFLRKWLKADPGDMDPRDIIDWGYYIERLSSVIMKLITIPAALQKLPNPVPRVAHPDWLQKRINIKDDKFKQKKMTDMFVKLDGPAPAYPVSDTQMADMEDFGLPSTARSIVRSLGKRKTVPDAREPPSNDPFASLPEDMPSIYEDYNGWLQYQKKKWALQRHARERRRQLFGDQPAAANSGLSAHFRNAAEIQYTKTWQILQLRPSETLGVVNAWVLIENKIHSLKIKVPRSVYMNVKSNQVPPDCDIPEIEVQKVVVTLPNGHPSTHIFKLSMPEQVYVDESRKLAHFFAHPCVEGVYETQVPLVVRALLDLGSICSIDEQQKGVLGKGLEQGFDLSTLRRKATKSPYLDQNKLQYLFFYHVVAGDRQIFGLFSTLKGEAQVIIHQTAKDAVVLPNMDKIYGEQLARRMAAAEGGSWQKSFEYQEALHFKVTSVNTKNKLNKAVADAIKALRSDDSAPMIMVIQSPRRAALLESFPVLNEFPVLPLRADPSDGNLPPLGWQGFVAKRIVTHYLSLGSWISHLMDLARYGDIPICNLEKDDPRFLIDIAYARRLQQRDVVLWWSPGAKPDHAGHEKDDILGSMETVDMPTVNNPGSYSSVCIEIDVRNLAINTILTSSLINELEGGDSVALNPAAPVDGEESSTNILFADNAFATAGILVLRDMVKAWWTEACKGNNMADIMVQHLVRWVESPDSFLYDRALHYYVQTMSKKAFLQLMTDFRRVGSNIVYANANRLIVQTSKSEVGNAYAYSHYILKAIKTKPLFHFLDLEIKEYWDYLVWYDDVNYGGKACTEVVEVEEQTLSTIMHWQLARFLPESLQEIFNQWIIEFIEIMHSQKTDAGSDVDISTPRATQLRKPLDEDNDKIILGPTFSKPLRKQIAQLVRRQHEAMLHPELAVDYDFPTLPGAIKTLKNPALQLIRSLTAIFGLAKEINIEARMLRKELLSLLDIKEFSKDGIFENPSETLRFSQVICNECTMPRDLDLCKDDELMPDPHAGGTSKEKAWKCAHCGNEYDKLAFEECMIQQLQMMVTQYNTQDLKCGKCGTLKVNEFAEHCTCSGVWVCTVERQGLVKRLEVYRSVARFYGFDMLMGVAENMLAYT